MDEPPGSLLDPAVLRQLFQRLASTDVDELEIVDGSSRLYLRREPGRRLVTVPGRRATTEHLPADGIPLAAPLTGVLWMRPSPEEEQFAAVGDMVEAGQVVALIETMKLFNEVIADVAGEVVSIAAREGDLVEVGQPLIFVKPREESEEA